MNVKEEISVQNEENNYSEQIKIVLLADVHMGNNRSTRPGEEAPFWLRKLVNEINFEIKPDAFIDLGDRINDSNREDDRKNAERYFDIIETVNVPYFFLLGNHDVHYLSEFENKKIYGNNSINLSVKIKGIKFIFINTADPVEENIGGNVSEKQLEWLKKELDEENIPKVIFGHHPIDDQDISGNPHFLSFPHLAFVQNKEAVRKIVKNGKNVVAYINGHVHWFSFYTDNHLPFFSVPSFIESWPEKEEAPGMYVVVTIKENGESVFVLKGINPKRIYGKFFWHFK